MSQWDLLSQNIANQLPYVEGVYYELFTPARYDKREGGVIRLVVNLQFKENYTDGLDIEEQVSAIFNQASENKAKLYRRD